MATGRAKSMKRRRRRRRKINYRNKKHNVPSIDSIPSELMTEVLARVAASSSDDFFNAKLSCKIFNEVADDDYVFQHVSLEKFPVVPWCLCEKASSFLKRCMDSGNPEALYRQGVVDYFSCMKLESGVECLKKAAISGHMGAQYVMGIILLFCGEELKQMGIEILSGMKKSKVARRRVRECRKNLESMIRKMWIRNSLIVGQKPTCCTMQGQHKKRRGWPTHESDDEEDDLQCKACRCDIEVASIYDMMPRCII